MRLSWLQGPPRIDLEQEIARQAALLRREAPVRFPAMALAFAVSLLFLPVGIVASCIALVILCEVVLNRLDAEPARMAEGWRHPVYIGTAFVLEVAFIAPPVMMWHIENPFVKAFAIGLVVCSMLHIATVRSIHLPMGLAGAAAVAILSLGSNTLYWVPRHDLLALLVTTACALVALFYSFGAIILTNRLHRETAQGRAEAIAANATKDRFLAQMSHELRTPLNAILGMGHAELRRTADPISRDRLGILIRSAEGLSTILDDILDMSAVQQGRMPIRPQTVNPRDEISTSVELFRPLIEEAGVALQVQLGNLSPRVRLDPQRLRQCLSNLLSNALKFTRSGRIRVEATMEVGGPRPILRIEVSDTGEGIPPEEVEAIFEPFTRTAGSGRASNRMPGNGLGLSISRALARQMGGDLTVLPPHGRGARFGLTLAVEPVAETTAPPPRRGAEGWLAGHLVLVVDDIATNRLVAAAYLKLFGIRTIEVPSGSAALEALMREPVDLVLLDMNMPDMDGLETFQRIRALPEPARHVPVVAMTADAMEDQRDGYLAAGLDGYIAKPVTPDRIAAELLRALRAPRGAAMPQ
ncbi:response regulator [Cereibacter sphaeroides]|uniref:ATP-binding protein n=1 Tax=Cereibacter sphaeroides TaxID=1063 RepID=UPI001F443984|nr:ATP-binding protein [Cereibacter sphaeroides]MCE6961470.1 response regulator [Cereibacter sphaeroides]MCE6967349.1 response regulator [Cereibacter sphaeroides]MCE6971499.1 response regulator [Cereibacter sphaeroides]